MKIHFKKESVMKKRKSNKRSAFGRIKTAILSLVALIAVVLVGFIGYVMLPVSSYYGASERAFEIPGLNDDFVPQGFCYDSERNYFIMSGYSSDGASSPIYIVDRDGGALVRETRLLKEDGSSFTGHAGGVAIWRDYLYVAGGSAKCLYVYSYSDVLSSDTAKCIGKVSLKSSDNNYVSASFVTVHANVLTVGEFYDGEKYTTLDWHTITTNAGDENHALAYRFELSPDVELGVIDEPFEAYSIPNKVQGLCFDDNMLYLSTSYGLKHSYIYEYDISKAYKTHRVGMLGDTSIPVYEIDSSCLVGEYKLPPMSEEILMLEDRLYTMCESASPKYIFGKLTCGKWCYATNLDEMK